MSAAHPFRFVVLLALFVLFSANAPNADNANAIATSWLARVNFYRAMASLPPVFEEPMLSAPVAAHARYMVANDVIQHSQNRKRSWSSREGAVAATMSNLAASTNPNEPDSWAVDAWMQAPFHAVGILDPALRKVGFGIHREHDGRRIQTAAGLDVIRGRSTRPVDTTYPIVWPANGTSVPIGMHTSEYPNPLTSCPGYTLPAGLPVIVQMGAGGGIPQVTRTSISEGTRPLEHCVFDESTYRNPNAAEQALGRRVLAFRDAIVLIPREPLQVGSSYRVLVEANGRSIDWVFTVAHSPVADSR